MKNILFAILLIALFVLSSACKKSNDGGQNDLDQYSSQVVIDWNNAIFQVMSGPAGDHTLLVSRIGAMTQIAVHDALNAIAPRYETYAFDGKNKHADPVAAVATAAYEVLVASQPNQKAMLDSLLAVSLAKVPEGQAKNEGIDLGKKSAAAILDLRKDDGAFQDPIGIVVPSTEPGVYQVVPPFNFVFGPHWRTMQTFSLQKFDQFRISPMPALTSEAYTAAFNEVKRIGQKDSQYRSGEQSYIAKYWYEFSEIGWNRVARIAATDRKLDILATARLLALVNMALADAYTAGWDSKFHYNFWRPYTAIRAAETDGNPDTDADPQWEPAEPTPPVQDYPSTHSALGNAAATVLAALLGDDVTFTMHSNTTVPAGGTRTFHSFSQAAAENAESRVLAGIHFRFSCEKGLELGEKIGKWTVENHLKPVE